MVSGTHYINVTYGELCVGDWRSTFLVPDLDAAIGECVCVCVYIYIYRSTCMRTQEMRRESSFLFNGCI